jgi:hypothetical protein
LSKVVLIMQEGDGNATIDFTTVPAYSAKISKDLCRHAPIMDATPSNKRTAAEAVTKVKGHHEVMYDRSPIPTPSLAHTSKKIYIAVQR